MRPDRPGRMARIVGWPLLTVIMGISLGQEGRSAEKDTAPAESARLAFFRARVEPVLRTRCLKCHGGEAKARGNLRLDSREAVLRGGDQGPAATLDQPEASLILQAIRYKGPEMPPSGKLPQDEIDALKRWVKEGLTWPAEGQGVVIPVPSADRDVKPSSALPGTWPYRPVIRPPVPGARDQGWVKSPIDAFIMARLEAEGLRPVPAAGRVALIRRLTYDLTGLPPTPEEVDAFVADRAADAYEHLVDRLLASPEYGAAWGRHWLDLVRYAETNGYERDSAKPYAWRYRDYVIAAFNRDKPYDRFVLEQIAGDLIDPDSAEALIATGFYRLGLWDDEPADPPLARYNGLDDIVSTTGQAILGLSINCARCHDHKKDPIPQRDYYRLLAFFHDVTHPDGKNLRMSGPTRDVPVMCVREEGHAPAHVLLRGNPNLVGPQVEPGVPQILECSHETFNSGSGKRLALARWLTERNNPMTARVMVNRLWQFHFGRGIVPTPSDFGQLGEPSSHPELLDWLAAEFVEGGWKIKRMHRLILLSSAYRMSSGATESGLAKDPGNRWFWRFPMRRLAAEEVRDSILAVSGSLNNRAGGPSICPPIPREVLAGQSIPGQGWKISPPGEAARRSVFVHVKRSLQLPILATHDSPDTDSSCPVRYTTTVPTQALGLLNGAFANEQAERFARRLRSERPGCVADQVRRAIRLTTCANPSEDEVARDVSWIDSMKKDMHLTEVAALREYCLLTLSTNAFLYLD